MYWPIDTVISINVSLYNISVYTVSKKNHTIIFSMNSTYTYAYEYAGVLFCVEDEGFES